jgi:hypothetical protein
MDNTIMSEVVSVVHHREAATWNMYIAAEIKVIEST